MMTTTGMIIMVGAATGTSKSEFEPVVARGPSGVTERAFWPAANDATAPGRGAAAAPQLCILMGPELL